MKNGTPVFDGIAVMEIQANLIGPTVNLVAKAAFVNSRTGMTHGSTTNQQWSPETIERLKALRESMEEDLARTHFEEDGKAPPGGGLRGIGGLNENLDNDDTGVPQVSRG